MSQLRGAELFACQLSNHLIKHGHDVLVVILFEGEANLPFTGKIINLQRPESSRMWDIKGWMMLNCQINEFNPDIIQANAADTLKYAVSAKFIGSYKIPIVLRNANKAGDFIDSFWKKQLNKFYLSKVSYVISVSRECEQDFIKTFDYPPEKISTVKIGVENAVINDLPEDLLKIFQEEIVIAHVGSFVPEKNHIGLIRIFQMVQLEFPDAQLLLIGAGPLSSEITHVVRQLGINENVHFLGSRTDVLDILHKSNIFVLPSLIEGLPGVLLEAMYCEIPVIAYDVGGISEIITTETGDIIEKNEEKAFFQAIIKNIKNPNQLKIKKARQMILNNYLNRDIALQFIQVYKKAISISTE